MEQGFVTCRDDASMIDIVKQFIDDQFHTLDSDDAFSLMDLGYHVEMVDQWKQILPRVMPFFAVKCEPDPILLRMMAQMNFGFDCASKGEIEQIIGLGVHPSRILYAHPRKQPSHIRYASAVGVEMTVFDDKDELFKIKKDAPNMRLLLRISTKGLTETAIAAMIDQFGCQRSQSMDLLRLAKELGLNVCGVSYHMGIHPRSIGVYDQALRAAAEVLKEGISLGFNMEIVDVGGSLPCNTTTEFYYSTLKEVATVMNKVIEEEFDQKVKIIAEPGSPFALPSSVLVTNIIGTRKQDREISTLVDGEATSKDGKAMREYFINDGLFSSFRHFIDTGTTPLVNPVNEDPQGNASAQYKSRIWGQTLGGDLVINECMLPEMKSGDWLYFPDMGGYSHNRKHIGFNGFPPPPVHRFIREASKNRLNELIKNKPFFFEL